MQRAAKGGKERTRVNSFAPIIFYSLFGFELANMKAKKNALAPTP